MASPVRPAPCAEKWRLMMAFTKAVSELNRIQSAQVAAALRGDGFQFAEEWARAEQAKLSAKYAVLAHQQEHGC